VYYDVATTATFNGQVTLCFGWTEGQFANEGAIALFHFENGLWQNVTTLLDTASNFVCGRTTSLSPFALMQLANSLPTAAPGSATTREGVPVTVTLSGGDLDSATITFAISQSPAHGTLGPVSASACTPAPGGQGFGCQATVVYTPAAGYTGPDSFRFTASDGTGTSAPATISITVNPKLRPVVSLGAPASAAFGTTFVATPVTQASTQATVTVDASSTSVCSIVGLSVTMASGSGTCVINASWPADATYLAATASASVAAQRAPTVTTVTAPGAVYDGNQHGATANVSGAGLNAALDVTYTGIGATSYGPTGVAPINAGTYAVTAAYAGDANREGSAGSATLAIAPATAQLEYTGLGSLATFSPEGATANVLSSATLKVTVGDISTASVTFTSSQQPGGIAGCTHVPMLALDAQTATAICEWQAPVGGTQVAVALDAGNYTAPAGVQPLAITQAVKGVGITGSGQLSLSAAVGRYAGPIVAIQPNARFSEGPGNELRGELAVAVQRGSTVFAFDATSVGALSVNGSAAGVTGIASGSTWDTANPSAVSSLGSGLRFQLRAIDGGEPGAGHDALALTVWDASGALVLATRWTGMHTDAEPITAGNIQVK
jgi:hypothetical protein